MRERSISKLYMWGVIGLAAIICAHSVYRSVHEPELLDWKLLLLFSAALFAGRFLRVKIPKANADVSIVDGLIFLVMLLYGGNAAVLMATSEALYWASRFNKKLITILTNGAGMACSTFITSQVLNLCFGPTGELASRGSLQVFIAAVCSMGFVQFILNTTIIAVAVALKKNLSIWHTWSRYYLWTSLTFFGGALTAGLTAKLILAFGFYGLIVPIPIIASLYFTYRMYLKNVEVSILQAEMAEQHVIELSHYVAELKQAEEALKKSESDYRGLFENAHDAIMIIVPENEVVMEVNQRACDMYGLSRNVFVGLSLEAVTKNAARGKARIREVLEKGSSIRFESVHYRSDGSEMYLDIIATVVDYKDRRAILAINRDITERRELEEQLRQVQKMESIGTLAGGIAHDFNNLMAAVTGYSTMLLMDIAEDDPHREDIEEIKKAADRATSLTRQLLAFSRKQMLQPKVLNLNSVVTDVSKMLSRLIGENIRLMTDLDPALWRVEVDPAQMEQVLINLAVNSRDAMPQGGTLMIMTANIELGGPYCRHLGLPPDDYILLSVSDTGCGMDEETQARIFEPFFTTKGVGKGTGLGLSMVHGIVKQSGGEVEVQSAPERGAHFRIYLPRVKGDDAMKEQESRSKVSLNLMGTALLVEDDPVVRRMAQNMLQRFGFRILVAEDPDEALRIAASHQGEIQLMLTDVVMPRMSGRELADMIKTSRPETSTLYMSGYTEDAIIQHGLRSDALHFIQKPFTPDELASKISEVLEGAQVEVS